MPKATKVISGTKAGTAYTAATGTPVYTVPTGKVARIEILFGTGAITSDGSIYMIKVKYIENLAENQYLYLSMSPPLPPTGLPAVVPNNYAITVSPVFQNPGYSIASEVLIVRNVTYLKAGETVNFSPGKYSILVVEEDAG